VRESLLGPCSLLMIALDVSTSDTDKHTLSTNAQITSAAAAADMHKDTGLAHRLTDVALALHAMGQDSCPCPRKPMLCQYLVLLHSPDTCSSSSSCSDAMRMRVLATFAAPRSLQDLLLDESLPSLFSCILPIPGVLPRLRPGRLSPGDALDPLHERTASGAPSASLGHRAFIAAETPPGPQCTSQATHRP
jgi:hypothetical protein